MRYDDMKYFTSFKLQPKSATEIGNLNFERKKEKKKVKKVRTSELELDVVIYVRRVNHGTCSYIRMYINAVTS